MSFAVITIQNAAAFRQMFKKHGVLKLPTTKGPKLPPFTLLYGIGSKGILSAKKSISTLPTFPKNILGIRHDERLERLNITRQVAGITFVVHIFADVGVVDDAVLMILSSVKMVTYNA